MDGGIPFPDGLLRLRAATADLHRRVEETAPSARVLAGTVGRADYLDFLCRTRRALIPAEAFLAAAMADLPPDLAACADAARRGAALDADIAALGGSRSGPVEPLPLPPTPGTVVGLLYVMEGSALGGAVISRHVRTALGPDADGFTRFHSGAGLRAGERWARVRGLIAGLDAAGTDDACAAAVTLFDRFLDACSTP